MGQEIVKASRVRDARGLTPMQAAFVSAYMLNGGNATAAARVAGYREGDGRPDARAGELMRKPHVLAAIRDEQTRLLGGELATIALGALRQVLTDDAARPSDKVQAAKIVLDRAGFHPAQLADKPRDDKPLEEMSIPELEAMLEKLGAELRTIEATPASAPAEPETPGESGESSA